MRIERGVMGTFPWAAVGAGPPLVVLAGLSPATGVRSNGFVRTVLAPVQQLADRRQVFAVNRRPDLPSGLTMAGLAQEHAYAIRSYFGAPVDLVGMSTGGSIAQQLAADHPDTIRRLVLVSTACRLGPLGRELQSAVAADLRSGRSRRAMGEAAAGLVPVGRRVARSLGWLAAPRLLTTPNAGPDLAATIEAEDGFDLALCPAAITAKTLIVAGGRDRFYTPALFRETAALIANSQLAMFANRGHLGVVRDRRALASIAGFLTWG